MSDKKSKKMSLNVDDEMISRLVRKIRYDVPLPVEAELNRHFANWEKNKKIKRRVFGWYPAAAALAALLIIALVFIIRPFMEKERRPQPISVPQVADATAVTNRVVLASPPARAIEQSAGEPETLPIREIRTEFELKDKNIKIIWFQKKDFKLRRTKS